eukprot:2177822-Amphidinium_carterae.2
MEVEIGHHIVELNGKPSSDMEPDQVQRDSCEMPPIVNGFLLRNGPLRLAAEWVSKTSSGLP